nr:MAG TPA: hypothetical protein [Caudoviricetes sp.]
MVGIRLPISKYSHPDLSYSLGPSSSLIITVGSL